MFIKEAYDRRQKHNDQEHDVLQNNPKLHQIGSIRNHKIHYDKDEQFFSKEEMGVFAMQAKEIVRTFVDPDILGLRKKEWQTSVAVPKNPLQEETHERKLVKIRLGLFDHPIPKERPNRIFDGLEYRNDYTGWNVSTEINNQQVGMDLLSKTQKAMTANKNKEAELIKDYVRPIEHQNQITNSMRRQKSQEKELRDRIREEYELSHPGVSKEAKDGAVFRLAYEDKLRRDQQQIQDKNITFKPDMSRTLKNDITFKFMHNGVYSKQPDGSEGWSCCMQDERESKGCQKIKVDRNKWDYSSFTH